MLSRLRQRVLSIVVLITLIGSILVAIVEDDVELRTKFMGIASSSLGSYWALQHPEDDEEDHDDDDDS